MWNWIFWISPFCLVIETFFFYVLLVGLISEFALGTPNRNEAGELRINKNSFVIKYLFRNNFWVTINRKVVCPRNDCQVIRGFFWGIPVNIAIMFVFGIIIGIAGTVGLVCGFIPLISRDAQTCFKPYQTYGKENEKKFIAPWKFLLPLGMGYLVASFWEEIIASVLWLFGTVSSFFQASAYATKVVATNGLIPFLLTCLFLCFFIFLIIFLSDKKTQEKWAVAKDWLSSKKPGGFCRNTEIVDE